MYGYSAYLTDVRVTEKKHIFYISISKRIHEFVEKFKIYKFYSMMYVSLRNACEIHISDFMAAFDSRELGEFFLPPSPWSVGSSSGSASKARFLSLCKPSASLTVEGRNFPFVSGNNRQRNAITMDINPKKRTGRLDQVSSRSKMTGASTEPIRDDIENMLIPLVRSEVGNSSTAHEITTENDMVMKNFPRLATRARSIPYGTKGVKEQAMPLRINVKNVVFFLPNHSATNIQEEYAGISMAPDMRKEMYGSIPSDDVLRDNP